MQHKLLNVFNSFSPPPPWVELIAANTTLLQHNNTENLEFLLKTDKLINSYYLPTKFRYTDGTKSNSINSPLACAFSINDALFSVRLLGSTYDAELYGILLCLRHLSVYRPSTYTV